MSRFDEIYHFLRFVAAILDFPRHFSPNIGNSWAPLQDALEDHQEQLLMICKTFTSMVTPNKILHVYSCLLKTYLFKIN